MRVVQIAHAVFFPFVAICFAKDPLRGMASQSLAMQHREIALCTLCIKSFLMRSAVFDTHGMMPHAEQTQFNMKDVLKNKMGIIQRTYILP